MFKRILVPLDGSAQAEQALPVAARLARASSGSALLLRVVSTLNEYELYTTEPTLLMRGTALHEDLIKEAAAYLARQAASTTLTGITTSVAVVSGHPAAQILDVAQTEQVDLIIIGGHATSGIKRWIVGSVAQKVVRHSTAPVLVLHESDLPLSSLTPTVGHPIRALVALESSPFSEVAVMPAAQLVAACSAPARGTLHLVHLVNLPKVEEELAYEQLGLDVNFRQAALYQAGQYLQAIKEQTCRQLPAESSVGITWSVEECQDVADALLKIARGEGMGTHTKSDLMVLATHGRSGLERWLAGSVAKRILHHATLPLLIVHPHTEVPSFTAPSGDERKIALPH